MKSGKFIIIIFFLFISLSYNLMSQQDTTQKPAESDKMVMAKSPSGAIYRSLALPGWGQWYVESYWKAPLFFAGAGTLVYFIIDNNNKYNDFAKKTESIADKESDEYKLSKSYREYYRDNRDMSGFYLIAVYILAAVDAYVGAHLYDFQVNDNITMNLGVMPASVPTVSLNIRF